ncbi:MAG: transcriptional regulator [Firmicutes bacterium]|nr:transcriptional regulator [Bacillota bacterium]
MKKTLGRMLREKIKEKNISRVDLCRGLCAPPMLTKYLNGERRMDRLLLTALMQRLGLSPDKFATLLTEKEYIYFDWRQRLAQAQLDREWEKVMTLLEEDALREPACNPAIQEQFYIVVRARAEAALSGDKSGVAGRYREAVRRTVPDFPGKLGVHTYLSMQEISFMLLWSDSCQDREQAAKVLSFLEGYIPARFSEEREKVKLYPKVAARYLPILCEQGRYHECMVMAERALNMMAISGYASSMEAVLDSYVKAAEGLGTEEQVHREKVQLGAWRELMQEIGQTGEKLDDELYMTDIWQEADLLDEVLRRNRQYQGYSQEELSEGICTPETLSRIETGRRAPNTGTFRALAEKLNLREDYYYSNIETDDLALLDQEWQITTLIMNRKWEQAEKVLKEMKAVLDLSYSCNRQYVENEEFTIECGLGRIPIERQFETVRKILAITVEEVPGDRDIRKWREDFWNRPFSGEEIAVMMKMADALRNEKKWEQKEYLLEKLLGYYQKSKVKPEFHFRRVILIVGRLTGCTGRLEKWEKELNYSEEGIRLCRVSGTGKMLPLFLNNKADALEHLGKKETSLKYYRLAFYSAELFGKNGTAEIAKRSYEKLHGQPINWY